MNLEMDPDLTATPEPLGDVVKSVTEQGKEVNRLRTLLAQAEKEYTNTADLRELDPIMYLGRLVYTNKVNGGSFGYEYGVFGDSERETAQALLDLVDGNIDIAERVIVALNVKHFTPRKA